MHFHLGHKSQYFQGQLEVESSNDKYGQRQWYIDWIKKKQWIKIFDRER